MRFNFEHFVSITRERSDTMYGLCPFHNDRHPSFIANTETGRWKCFAGCGGGDFLEFERCLESSGSTLKQCQSPRPVIPSKPWDGYKRAAEYIYIPTNGKGALKVVRYEHPFQAKRFAQFHLDDLLQWAPGRNNIEVKPYLYLEWASSGDPILFVEGEKCAEVLRQYGFLATTVPGGASGWKASYRQFFQGKTVFILPDNDEVGFRYAEAIKNDLFVVAANVKIVRLPDLMESQDVVDWLQQGNSSQDLLKLMTE